MRLTEEMRMGEGDDRFLRQWPKQGWLVIKRPPLKQKQGYLIIK